MVRYRDGDLRAFDELYERYERRVYGFCLHFLGDPDRAADAFQDTFRRLVDGRDRFRPRGRFASWLFTLARRSCADLLRAQPKEKRYHADETAGAGAATLRSPGLEQEILDRAEVERLLASLPTSQREVLLLSKYYGFTHAEIAEIVGATEAAVKQRLYRALKSLQARL